MGKDYYGTLGVKRDADENELKKGCFSDPGNVTAQCTVSFT